MDLDSILTRGVTAMKMTKTSTVPEIAKRGRRSRYESVFNAIRVLAGDEWAKLEADTEEEAKKLLSSLRAHKITPFDVRYDGDKTVYAQVKK